MPPTTCDCLEVRAGGQCTIGLFTICERRLAHLVYDLLFGRWSTNHSGPVVLALSPSAVSLSLQHPQIMHGASDHAFTHSEATHSIAHRNTHSVVELSHIQIARSVHSASSSCLGCKVYEVPYYMAMCFVAPDPEARQGSSPRRDELLLFFRPPKRCQACSSEVRPGSS